MGRWSESNWDAELISKTKIIFEEVCDKLRKDNPDKNITFEEFIKLLDTDDKVTRRVFEFLVKETFSKNGVTLAQAATNRGESTVHVYPFPSVLSGNLANNQSSQLSQLHFIPLPEHI